MASNSFFGFDASIPCEDDGGGGLEDREENYDALNSETFGSAINGDWEFIHENLVRLDGGGHRLSSAVGAAAAAAAVVKDDIGESDLELNLSRVGMNDFDVAKEDNEGRIQLDPSVWASPLRPTVIAQRQPPTVAEQVQPQVQPQTSPPSQMAAANVTMMDGPGHPGMNNIHLNPNNANNMFFVANHPESFLRQHFPNPFGGPVSSAAPGGPSSAQIMQQQLLQHQQQFMLHQQHQQQRMHEQQQSHLLNQQNMLDTLASKTANLKIMSVEDLERNILNATQAMVQAKSLPPIGTIAATQTPPLIPNNASIAGGASPSLASGQPARLPPGFAPMPSIVQSSGVGDVGPSPLGNMQRPMPTIAQMHAFGGLRPPQLPQQQQAGPNNVIALAPGQPIVSPQQSHAAQQQQIQQAHRIMPPMLPMPPPPQQQQPQQHPMMSTPPPNHPSFPGAGSNAVVVASGGNQNMQFNQRLVQEIQQNHPLLAPQFNHRNHLTNSAPPQFLQHHPHMLHPNHPLHMQQMLQKPPLPHPFLQQQHQLQMQQQMQQQNSQQQPPPYPNNHHNGAGAQLQQRPVGHKQQQQFRGNGNLSEDFDEYANLMSMRDKQWLITIQLSQLRTETPYLDDFYYTVFKERRQKASGQRENRAHQDNQMNHPFTQPSGQVAQLARITWNQNNHQQMQQHGNNNHSQSNSSNSNNNSNTANQQHQQQQQQQQRNTSGAGGNSRASSNTEQRPRERKTSESGNNNNNNKDSKDTPRSYAPQQFENSLGKLQCGSVTAPRKVIDMDVVGADTSAGSNSSSINALTATLEITTQRKSKQLLIHIESLYRLVLKLEDKEHPTAMAAHQLIMDRKMKDYDAAMSLRNELRGILKDPTVPEEVLENVRRTIANAPPKPKEIDDRDELLGKVLAGLGSEKAAQMMTVRKGKTLLRRTLPLIKDVAQRWDIWYGICSTLPIIVKKDKDDADGLLFALFPLFKDQLTDASMDELLKLGGLMTAGVDTRKVNYMFMNKFCISCVIVLLLRAEALFVAAPDTISDEARASWPTFLRIMATTAAANVQANQTLSATLQGDVLQPLLHHFERFAEVPSKPLLAALAQQTTTTGATAHGTAA